MWGWCHSRQDFRLFKLNRMVELRLTGRQFIRREVPLPDLRDERIFPGGIKVKALFDADCKWRLIEEFGTGCFAEQEDGKLLFTADYTDRDNLLSWLMTFREKVTLLEPKELREEIRFILDRMQENY